MQLKMPSNKHKLNFKIIWIENADTRLAKRSKESPRGLPLFVAASHYQSPQACLLGKWWNRELTLKCKLKCYVKPMKDPLGVSPSKGNQGTTRGKEKIP